MIKQTEITLEEVLKLPEGSKFIETLEYDGKTLASSTIVVRCDTSITDTNIRWSSGLEDEGEPINITYTLLEEVDD